MIRRRRHLAGVLALSLLLAACGSGSGLATAGATADAGSAEAPAPTAVPNPGASDATGADPGGGAGTGGSGTGGSGTGGSGTGGSGGGSTGGNPGTGILDPGTIGGILVPGGAGGPAGAPLLVTPTANVRDPHDVAASRLEVAVDDSRVTARVSWTSGVEPCYALAGIDVEQNGTTITLTVREGSAGDPGTMCTEQAVLKAAVVDLGELAPGTWTIVAAGDAPPVEITLAG